MKRRVAANLKIIGTASGTTFSRTRLAIAPLLVTPVNA